MVRCAEAITHLVSRPWTLMEICGGQTHTIVKYGLDELLPPGVTLVHGPGCPVCVTAVELIDAAIELALEHHVILCSFGDMLRVPGSNRDLLSAKAAGAEVRIVYSPLDAVKIAADNPEREVVFFAVGFETTAPSTAMAVKMARDQNLHNFSMLSAHVLVPPAMEAILLNPECRIQGFLAAGHVCTVMGYREYEPITARFVVPIVVTGFEPLDLMQGIHLCLAQLESGKAIVENQYSRSVKREGNPTAQSLMKEVFTPVDRNWRGIGIIPKSGLDLNPDYQSFNARLRFDLKVDSIPKEPGPNTGLECIAGLILQGLKKPAECAAFRTLCTPEHPLGAPMVSSEGACAAYYRYRKEDK